MKKAIQTPNRVKIVNCADIAAKNWTFLKDFLRKPDVLWKFYSATPESWIERVIRKPNLARYKACLASAFHAKVSKADFIISHLPRATLWCGLFSRLLGGHSRHLAYSFNFTDLPRGWLKALMTYAFQSVDRFVVFSTAEKDLYAQYFKLKLDRIDVLKWSMATPCIGRENPVIQGDYVCAVGGEGRDYELLFEAADALKDIPFVVVARPSNLPARKLPLNVNFLVNAPVDEFWNIVAFSKFVIIPLKTATTNCGHITIVGSHLHDKPIVSTYSTGTSDYLVNGANSLLSPPRDSKALMDNIDVLWRDADLRERLQANVIKGKHEYATENLVSYMEKYLSTSR